MSVYQSVGITDYSFFSKTVDVNNTFNALYLKLYSLLNQFVPSVKAMCRKYPPWFNSDVIKLIIKKYKLFEICRSYHNPSDLQEFKLLRTYIKAESVTRYRSQCESVEEDIKQNPSRL